MIAVIAGNHQQYQNFIRDNKLSHKKYFYVSNFEKILGMRKLKYILYGTYYERKDFEKIELRLQIAEFEKMNKLEQRTTADTTTLKHHVSANVVRKESNYDSKKT